MRRLVLCAIAPLLMVAIVHGRTLNQLRLGLYDPFLQGSGCTDAELNASITAIGSDTRTIYLSPIDRGGIACVWTLGADVTVPSNITLLIAGSIVVNATFTLTVNGPHISLIGPNWYSGAGTVAFNYRQSFNAEAYDDILFPVVLSGGTHGTAAGMTSPAFATTYVTSRGVRTQASITIDYSAAPVSCANDDTAWVIAHDPGSVATLGSFQQSGSTDYYVDCTSAIQPALPDNSAWLMEVTITAGAIANVEDMRPMDPRQGISRSIVRAEWFGDVHTDIGNSISLAINNVQAFGGVVLLPCENAQGATNYPMTTAVTVDREVTIRGCGIEQTRISKNFNGDAFTITSGNVVLEGFRLNGNEASQTGNGIVVGSGTTQANFVILRDLFVRDNGTDDILIQCGNHGIIDRVRAGSGGQDAVHIAPTCSEANAWKIIYLDVQNAGRYGFHMEDTSGAGGVKPNGWVGYIHASQNVDHNLLIDGSRNHIWTYTENTLAPDPDEVNLGTNSIGNTVYCVSTCVYDDDGLMNIVETIDTVTTDREQFHSTDEFVFERDDPSAAGNAIVRVMTLRADLEQSGNAFASGFGAQLAFVQNADGQDEQPIAGIDAEVSGALGTGAIVFRAGNSLTERMRIDQNGRHILSGPIVMDERVETLTTSRVVSIGEESVWFLDADNPNYTFQPDFTASWLAGREFIIYNVDATDIIRFYWNGGAIDMSIPADDVAICHYTGSTWHCMLDDISS